MTVLLEDIEDGFHVLEVVDTCALFRNISFWRDRTSIMVPGGAAGSPSFPSSPNVIAPWYSTTVSCVEGLRLHMTDLP